MMENTGVICDVCGCTYNAEGRKCTLSQIKVTEQTAKNAGSVEEPHYCQSYAKRDNCGCAPECGCEPNCDC